MIGAFVAMLVIGQPVVGIAGTVADRPGRDAAASRSTAAEPIVIDGASQGRTFDGVGAVSAGGSSPLLYGYPEPERSQILDYLFKPGYGAALQLLKVEIGGDVNSTSGAEASHLRDPGELACDRGYEWWLMKEAKKRNPAIKLLGLEWGAPAWFDGGFWSQDNIDYLLAWLGCAKQHGLTIDYMGGWNEQGFDADWYVAWHKALAKAYPNVKIVAADECCRTDLWRVAEALATNPAFKAAVDVVGVHFACGNREARQRCSSTPTAQGLGLPLWSSENSSMSRHVGAEPIARALNRMYIDAKVTGFMSWSAVSAWYADLPLADTGIITAEWPWSGYYDVGKSVWAKAHTTQFAWPGWRYLDTGSARHASGATYVSRVSPSGEDFSTAIEGMDVTQPTTLTFELRDLPRRALHVWETDLRSDDPRDHFRHAGTVTPDADGRFPLTVESGHIYSVTTTTGQGKGDARPRASVAEQLPVPFTENFESSRPGGLARYFADVNGGFEIARCGAGRSGHCYRQTVRQQPITWNVSGRMPPTTVAGDPRWWGDYQVSAQTMLEQKPGYVELLGRVDAHSGTRISGYHLRLADDGAWTLYAEDLQGDGETLARGTVGLGGRPWHRLSMSFLGNRITARIDDRQIAAVTDDGHRTGHVGLRSSPFQTAQFDDVTVTPTGPSPRLVPQQAITATATSEHTANSGGYEFSVPNAIDGRPETMWSSLLTPQAPLPQAITLDLGRRQPVEGLTYQPRLDTSPRGVATSYEIWLSDDGKAYRKVVAGTWPLSTGTKVVTWPSSTARYVRFAVTGSGSCPSAGVAAASELNVITGKPPEPTGTAEESEPDFDAYVPNERLSATASSIFGPGFEAKNAVDGDCRTFWHTSSAATGPLPATLTLDLGGEWNVEGIRYLPRQDGNANGLITGYTVSLSDDGTTYTEVARGAWGANALRKVVRWPVTRARYLRLTATAGTANVASAGTLDVGVSKEGS